MAVLQTLLPEFDHEMAGTRKSLERVPWEKRDWRPHDKSFTLGQLATHLGEVVSWGSFTLETDELDFATFDYKPPEHASVEDLLAAFDKACAASREAIATADDATAMATWTMRQGEQVIFAMPKIAVIRSFVLNHNVHHRAQLGVYLRLLDVPVPSLYGPTADEQ